MRALTVLAVAALAGAAVLACSEPRGTCVWTLSPPLRGVAQTCRDDATVSTCVASDRQEAAPVFKRGRSCPQIGFACRGTGIDAAFRRTNPDGTCPPGSSRD